MKTNQTYKRSVIRSERGAALIVVVLLCAFTLILIGSYLSALSSQTKIGHRATLQNEARNAAEGMAEYALAEMTRRAAANPSFGVGNNPQPLLNYTLPSADLAFIAPGTGNNHVLSSQVDYKAGALSSAPTTAAALDPADPVNADDPTKGGAAVKVKSMFIFAKAAVRDPRTNTNIFSYVSENVQIREQSWFNYAIFYNMDIEFHAGPNFDIKGPVHTNQSAYVTEGDGNKLQYFSNFSAVNKILRYDKYTGNTSGGHGGTVECISAAGMNATDLKPMSYSEDSRNTDFYTVASNKWNKYVQDKTFKVSDFKPAGLPAYSPEDFSTVAVELRNSAYLMIEPQLSIRTGDADYGQKDIEAENLKFSALSGFVIRVSPPATIGAQPQWKLIAYQATDPTRAISSDNLPVRDAITGKPVEEVIIDPFNDLDDSLPSPQGTIQRALKKDLQDAIASVPYRDGGTVLGTTGGNGTSDLLRFNAIAPASTSINYYPIYDRREGYIYPGSSTSAPDGMKGAMNVLQIDLGKLKTLLNTTSRWQKPYGNAGYVYYPPTRYSGVVYVQFPLAPITASRFSALGGASDGDKIRPAQGPDKTLGLPGYAVLLVNGTSVPQLTGGTPDGFTIATNGPLYVSGHFNADGDPSTGSSTNPDTAAEVPALIAADSVTILSSTLNFVKMGQSPLQNAADFTEISAAIITGLVPTNPGYNNVWSGGVHNLVRFHEDWGGSTYRYRGSLAALYESEVAKSAYHEGYNGYFYSPPTRDLGYHQYLAQGRFPPATPVKRTVRRMNLQDISAATYNAGPPTPVIFN